MFTPLPCDHHWLPIAEHVEYTFCTSVFRCLLCSAPWSYLVEHVLLTSSISRRDGLRSADTLPLDVPRTLQSFGDGTFIATAPRAWSR